MYEPLDAPGDAPPRYVKKLLNFWVFMLIPWFPFAAMAGLAFDGGSTFAAYLFVWSVWTYPVVLIIAMILKRWIPNAMFLPFLNVVGFVLSGSSHRA